MILARENKLITYYIPLENLRKLITHEKYIGTKFVYVKIMNPIAF
jgi:hypothetical protein